MFNKIAFIGAGSMTEAIISGMLNKNFLDSKQIHVINKNNKERLDYLSEHFKINCVQEKSDLIKDADIIVLSMKPYDLKEALLTYKEMIKENQLIISVVAGISTTHISTLLGNNAPVIRAMPNTSASIGYAATAVAKGSYATDNHLQASIELFQTIGTTVVSKEEDLHAVTAVSGSGPAYVYYLVEAMEQAAVEIGLNKETAMDLIVQTVIGAGEMLKQSGESAATLRKKVTSPSGTTEAGVKTLQKHGFAESIIECIKSAQARSIELGKEAQEK